MKTFDQCKDEVANLKGHANWIIAEYRMTRDDIDKLYSQAAELYAQEVAKDAWERACEAQRKRTYEVLSLSSKSFLYPRDYDKLVEWMESGAKPVYQPNQEKL